MQVKNRLTTIRVRIHHHPISLVVDPRVFREVAREREQSAEQIGVFGVVQRADVSGRDDEQMRRRLGIQVPESEHVAFALDDGRRDLPRRDLAKHAIRHSRPPPPPPPPSTFPMVSQKRPPSSFSGGVSSTSRSFSSSFYCSAVSLLGVQTCTRTCRSPCPPSPRRGSPLLRSRYATPVCVPGSMRRVAWPYGVGTWTSSPSAAWAKVMARS